MITEVVRLHDHFENIKENVTLKVLVPENFPEWAIGKKRKALLIIPGGSYRFVSYREAEPVALKFLGEDIACFILNYSCFPNMKFPEPIIEAMSAIAYIRRNAEKYNILKDSISVLGFSAGGHLAASVSCYYDDKELMDLIGVREDEVKVNGCLLGYPVISKELTIEDTMDNISGGDEKLLDKLSIDKHVTSKFPKTFIWAPRYDGLVPVVNSIELCKQLVLHDVLCEFHMYPFGDHGEATCDELTYSEAMISKEDLLKLSYNKDWLRCAIHFIKEVI